MRIETGGSHHDLPCVDRKIGIVERPVELLLCLGLVGRVVVWGKVWVGKGLLGLDSLPGVEDQHVLEQIDGCVV
jgi:hypothetical protein